MFSISNIDAVEFMASINTQQDENYVITDPPYGNVDSPHYEGRVKDPVLSPEYIEKFSSACFQKATGTFLFCSLHQTERWSNVLRKVGYEYVRTGVWIKPNAYWTPTPYTGGALEGFVYACKHRKDGTHSRIPAYVCSYAGHIKDGERKHPFRKPIPLVRQVIRDINIRGKNIIDPFAGGGSIGVASLLEGNNSLSNDLDNHAIPNLQWSLDNFELWETSQPKRGIVLAKTRTPRKTHKPRAQTPVDEKTTGEMIKDSPPRPKRKTRPLTTDQKRAILLAMVEHTKRHTEDNNPMTEREFLELLLGPDFDRRMKKGEKRERGTLKRAYPVDKLWAECRFIRATAAKKDKVVFFPKDTAKQKREKELFDIFDELESM